ncbi:MAG: hypothetical protein HUJ76_00655 [Parasporobacterium sp.]|nr:hypothetical protein [Parasporobacterium sp.]
MKLYRLIALAVSSVLVLGMASYAGDVPPQEQGQQPPAGTEGQQQPGESAGDQQTGESAGDQQPGESGGSEGAQGMPPGGSGGGQKPEKYDAAVEVTEDASFDGETFSSETGMENVMHVFNGASVNVNGCSFFNSGEGNGGDQASFYGVGATVLVSDGELYIRDSEITSETSGGTGVFAYDKGIAYISDITVRNSGQGGCGGIHAAGGGTVYAWNLDVETTGGSSAAIRSDRGGGKMVVDGGKYVSQNGTGAIYCTADISVNNAYLYAGRSEAMAIEGKNTIRLFDCSLEGNMQASEVNDNRVWNCIVYQSMSGDSEVGTSEFDMIGGKLICHAGPVILNTNTASYITFRDCDVVYGEDTTYFLQVTGNSSSRTWGKAGANGARCIFSAYDQEIEHDVMYDTISNLDFYLMEDSGFEGAVICDDAYNGGYSGDGIMNMYIDKESEWEVTADSVITGTLYLEGKIEDAKVVGTDGTVYVDGDGYVVTVGGFSNTADCSAAGKIPVWEDYAVENPFK